MVLDRAVGPMDAVGTRFGLREARFEAILNTSTVTYSTANVAVLEGGMVPRHPLSARGDVEEKK